MGTQRGALRRRQRGADGGGGARARGGGRVLTSRWDAHWLIVRAALGGDRGRLSWGSRAGCARWRRRPHGWQLLRGALVLPRLLYALAWDIVFARGADQAQGRRSYAARGTLPPAQPGWCRGVVSCCTRPTLVGATAGDSTVCPEPMWLIYLSTTAYRRQASVEQTLPRPPRMSIGG